MEILYKMHLHFIYANSIPVICRTIDIIIIFIGTFIFLYKMFSLYSFKYSSDITHKDKISDDYIWKIETKEFENKENKNGSNKN